MICASYFGRVEILRLILENISIDIDLASEGSGHTPLTIACATGNYEIVKLLIDHNAEVNKPTYFHHTPLVCCF